MSAQQYYQNNDPPPSNGYNGQGGQGGYQQLNYPPPPQQHYQQQQYNNGHNGEYKSQQQYQAPPGPPSGYDAQQKYQQQPAYNMNPSAPYAPPNTGMDESQAPHHKMGDTAPFSQANEQTGARFRPKKRLNDPVFLVLFIVAFVGFVVLSAISITTFVQNNGLGGAFGGGTGRTGSPVTLNYQTLYLLLMCCVLGLAVAAIWLMLVRAFTKVILEITLALTVLGNIALAVYYYYIKYWSGAIIFTVIALLSVLFYWSMRKRIPLARILLQTTIDITKHHPVVYLIVFLGLIVQTAWNIWYAFTCIAIYVKWTPYSPACTSGCSSGKVAGLIFYATFAFIWTSQVIANVILCTLAGGIFGGWYYYGPRAANGQGLPKKASLKSFVRSITLSLGSIAFGSLIVTLLELLRMILQAVQQSAAADGDMIGQILACCAVCCVGCIQGMIEWFNKYAYIEISLYGKAYIQAAKDTWRLMKDRGIDALINDSLVGSVIMWGSYLNGFLCGLFAYLYLKYTNPAYNTGGQYTAPIILFAFLIGISMGFTMGSAIDSGVSTIFVGLGEDPMILANRSPELFRMIESTYPQVVQGVPRN